MNSEVGFGRKVLSAFEENGISFEHMPSGIDTMTIFVHQPEFEGKEQSVISAIHRLAKPDSIELEGDLALIAVVGRGMKSTRGTAGRIFSALAHANINVKMIDQGSSELNIIIGVSNADFENAIRAIYDIFVVTVIKKTCGGILFPSAGEYIQRTVQNAVTHNEGDTVWNSFIRCRLLNYFVHGTILIHLYFSGLSQILCYSYDS